MKKHRRPKAHLQASAGATRPHLLLEVWQCLCRLTKEWHTCIPHSSYGHNKACSCLDAKLGRYVDIQYCMIINLFIVTTSHRSFHHNRVMIAQLRELFKLWGKCLMKLKWRCWYRLMSCCLLIGLMVRSNNIEKDERFYQPAHCLHEVYAFPSEPWFKKKILHSNGPWYNMNLKLYSAV